MTAPTKEKLDWLIEYAGVDLEASTALDMLLSDYDARGLRIAELEQDVAARDVRIAALEKMVDDDASRCVGCGEVVACVCSKCGDKLVAANAKLFGKVHVPDEMRNRFLDRTNIDEFNVATGWGLKLGSICADCASGTGHDAN